MWFGDEARIGQKNKITRRWAKRGSRPSAASDQRTASTYIFGAICPKEGKAVGLILLLVQHGDDGPASRRRSPPMSLLAVMQRCCWTSQLDGISPPSSPCTRQHHDRTLAAEIPPNLNPQENVSGSICAMP